MSEWISVEDGLPEHYQRVLVSGHRNPDDEPNYWFQRCYRDDLHPLGAAVTHWMPMPEPPQ